MDDLELPAPILVLHGASKVLAYRCRRKGIKQESLDRNDICPCLKQPADWWTIENVALYQRELHAAEKTSGTPCRWCLEANGKLICHKEFEDKSVSAQGFQFALCAASQSTESPAFQRMINEVLVEGQLSHLSVKIGEHRKNEVKALALSVLSRQAQLRPGDACLDAVLKEAESMQGETNSHLLAASAVLSITQRYHRTALATIDPDPACGCNYSKVCPQKDVITDSLIQALRKSYSYWRTTLDKHQVPINTMEELLEWGLDSNKIKMPRGSYTAYNPLMQELFASIGKWAFVANRHSELWCGEAKDCNSSDSFTQRVVCDGDNGGVTRAPVMQQRRKRAGKAVSMACSKQRQRSADTVTPFSSNETYPGRPETHEPAKGHNHGSVFSLSHMAKQLKAINLKGNVNHDTSRMSILAVGNARASQAISNRIFNKSDCTKTNTTKKKVLGPAKGHDMNLSKNNCPLNHKEHVDKIDMGKVGRKTSREDKQSLLSPKGSNKKSETDRRDTVCSGCNKQKMMSDATKSRVLSKNDLSGKRMGWAYKYRGGQNGCEDEENSGDTKESLDKSSKLLTTTTDELDSEPCGPKRSACAKTRVQSRRLRLKVKPSPECKRGDNESFYQLAKSPDVTTRDNALDRLAPSPDINATPLSSSELKRRPRHQQRDRMLSSNPEPEDSMFLEYSNSPFSSPVPLRHNILNMHESWTFPSIDLSSPVEIPRGRSQRTRKGRAKPLSNQTNCPADGQSTEMSTPQRSDNPTEDNTDKENVIHCTPEREIGKSPFPLVTPKTTQKSKLALKKSQDETAQPQTKRAALNLRDGSENIPSNEAVETVSPTKPKAKRTSRKPKSEESIQDSKSEPLVSTVKETVQKKTTRSTRKGVTSSTTNSSKSSDKISLTVPKGNKMDTSRKGSVKSPCKRQSEANIDTLPTAPEKSPRKQSVPQAKTEAANSTTLKGKNKEAEPSENETVDSEDAISQEGVLDKELREIEQDALIVEPGSPDMHISENHGKTLKKSKDESPIAELEIDQNSSSASPCDTACESQEAPGCRQTLSDVGGDISSVQHNDAKLCFLKQFPTIMDFDKSDPHFSFPNSQRKTHKKPSKHDASPTEPEPQKQEPNVETASDDEEWMGDEQLEQERQKMATALDHIAFNGVDVKTFKSDLASLPPDYTVVQMTVVDFDPMNPDDGRGQIFVTRMNSELVPLTIAIPLDRMNNLRIALSLFEKILKMEEGATDPDMYWTKRYLADCDVMIMTDFLQLSFLGAHMWMLNGRPELLINDKKLRLIMRDFVFWLVEDVTLMFGGYWLDPNVVLALLDCLLLANIGDIEDLLSCVWPWNIAKHMADHFTHFQGQLFREIPCHEDPNHVTGPSWGLLRGPVVLILDKMLARLPWESMAELADQTVTRVPSFASLKVLLTMHCEKVEDPVENGVNKSDAVAVVDPEQNLPNSANLLLPHFEKIRGWTCLSQKPPTVSDLKAILTEHSLYVYCGHGWGKQFVGGEDLQSFRGKALAIIMGCYSSNMEYRPRVDSDGAPLYFLLAGCPAMVGNLWLVTDKDIDKLTLSMVHDWYSTRDSCSLSSSISKSRYKCKMIALNGFAPVIYGLPIQMVGPARK
ncbi:separin [Elysia marginata]|uniref:separase n=1 Tax=Elysia marginata TaxID=1093978 RepID=A0AAV4GIR9_9GAST|nr:separin [Elysia marginata]